MKRLEEEKAGIDKRMATDKERLELEKRRKIKQLHDFETNWNKKDEMKRKQKEKRKIEKENAKRRQDEARERQIAIERERVNYGRELVNRWNDNNHEYGEKGGFFRPQRDKKIHDFGDVFIEGRDMFGVPQQNVGSLTFNDYYDDLAVVFRNGGEYQCPKCHKSQKIHREHGEEYKCGRCGLNSRNYGNVLYVWE